MGRVERERDGKPGRDGSPVKLHSLAVLVVDDCCLYREGLSSMLVKDPDVMSARSASNWPEATLALEEGNVDVVLVNVSQEGSLEFLTAIHRHAPAARTVAIGVGDCDSEIIACAEKGVAGYVLRSQSFAHLMTVLRHVVAGETVVSPRASAVLMRRLAALAEERTPRVPILTDREDQILALLDRGMSNREIADRLTIEIRTVKNHVHNIFAKLGVSRRGEAVALMRGRLHLLDARDAGI